MGHEDNFLGVDVYVVLEILKKEKWLILSIIFLFGMTGLIYSFSIKEEFKSEGKILPEVQARGSSIGQFAGIAALAGVDLGNVSGGVDAVRPDLYPDVLKSTPFILRLFKEKIRDKSNTELIFEDFYKKEVLNGKVLNKDLENKFPQSKNYLSFDKQTERNINSIKERILCSYDKKAGVIIISVKMPDPVVAANVARFSMNYLTEYIIEYRTEKQKRDLDFLANRLKEVRGKYFEKQSLKAQYNDKMPLSALRLQSADLQRERIDQEYKNSSTFYNSLLQKYEEAKLKFQQETPVIKVLEPPTVPNFKSEPKKARIMLLFIALGFICSLTIVVFRKKNFKILFN